MRAALLIATAALVASHGHMTLPASTRHGGSIATGGACANQACFWFSNNVQIPTAPTLPNDMRTVQLNVTERPHDVYATSPWRAPGSAPVFGSGCGVAGGSKEVYLNGGAIKGFPQGMDGKDLNKSTAAPPTWKRGETARVAQAITANHGGGYSYRLCPADGEVSEACFQQHPLDFATDTSHIVWPNGTEVPFPMKSTRVGTTPKGSQWARDPIPGCYICDAYDTCGAPLKPVAGRGPPNPCDAQTDAAHCAAAVGLSGQNCSWYSKGGYDLCYDKGPATDPAHVWDEQVNCYARCDGTGNPHGGFQGGSCPAGMAQFAEPAPGYSGFGKQGWAWSIADTVKVPADIAPGAYLLSWRWDCEESTQVWQNCADIVVE